MLLKRKTFAVRSLTEEEKRERQYYNVDQKQDNNIEDLEDYLEDISDEDLDKMSWDEKRDLIEGEEKKVQRNIKRFENIESERRAKKSELAGTVLGASMGSAPGLLLGKGKTALVGAAVGSGLGYVYGKTGLKDTLRKQGTVAGRYEAKYKGHTSDRFTKVADRVMDHAQSKKLVPSDHALGYAIDHNTGKNVIISGKNGDFKELTTPVKSKKK